MKKQSDLIKEPEFETRYLARFHTYDFEFCSDRNELENVIRTINQRGYDLVSVTQDAAGVYTVFFRRPVGRF